MVHRVVMDQGAAPAAAGAEALGQVRGNRTEHEAVMKFAELAAAVDVPVVALVVGLLTRRIHARVGTTAVGRLAALREM